MSAVTRVRKILAAIDKRYLGHLPSSTARAGISTSSTKAVMSNKRKRGDDGRDRHGVAANTSIGTGGCMNIGDGQKNNLMQSASILQQTGRDNVVGLQHLEKDAREEVLLKATNRAIEKALNLAMFFQQAEGYKVTIRTGTISVVDDVIELNRPLWLGEDKGGNNARGMSGDIDLVASHTASSDTEATSTLDPDNSVIPTNNEHDTEMVEDGEAIQTDDKERGHGGGQSPEEGTHDEQGEEDEEEEEELPETQIRRMSYVQVGISSLR